MEEAYEELVEKTSESLLEVPTDLHVFTDLNVANDLVEDVFSIFQEVEQKGGEDDEDGEDGRDRRPRPTPRRTCMLEMMEEAEGKLDDMEMWLGEKADKEKVTTEAFDREEMPESGIATGALATEVEDMIGDLLEEDEEQEEQADDSATTHAMPDMPMGWEVIEGNIASYAAKGKSGNETPDHNEQDGRSNVGRQGMSTGETAAGSGTISEGRQEHRGTPHRGPDPERPGRPRRRSRHQGHRRRQARHRQGRRHGHGRRRRTHGLQRGRVMGGHGRADGQAGRRDLRQGLAQEHPRR